MPSDSNLARRWAPLSPRGPPSAARLHSPHHSPPSRNRAPRSIQVWWHATATKCHRLATTVTSRQGNRICIIGFVVDPSEPVSDYPPTPNVMTASRDNEKCNDPAKCSHNYFWLLMTHCPPDRTDADSKHHHDNRCPVATPPPSC